MNIPFNQFKRHYQKIELEIENSISKVLKSGWYILGNEVKQFEKQFSEFTEAKHCISVANGTEAIALALMALGISEGDEVITTALTAYPTITAIEMTGAIPVVADVNDNCLINIKSVERVISNKTKAIIPVHLYGQVCDMDELVNFSSEFSIPIVEDCAQAAGARSNGTHCGTYGALGCFSFYPTKNLGAFGDAGAIITNNDFLAKKLSLLRNYGQSERYRHDLNGINSRMDEIQAAILNVKLKYLDQWNLRRREIASLYNLNLPNSIKIERVESSDIFHLYPVLVEHRDEFMNSMKEKGIDVIVHYPNIVSEQKAFRGKKGKCENAENICSRLVSLPLNPEMTNCEIQYVIKAVCDSLK